MARLICKFGVLKYIPNSIKQEVVNVGVILHSSKERSVRVKFMDHDQRFKHFMTDVQLGEYYAFRRMVSKHVRNLRGKFVDPLLEVRLDDDNYLEKFQSQLKLPFLLSKPEFVFTENIDEQLEGLYWSLVLDPDEVRTKQKTLIKQVEERIVSAGLDQYFERGIEVKNLPFSLNIEFGFRKEQTMDLVQPISFQGSPRENYKEGVFWRETIQQVYKDSDLQAENFIAVVKRPKNNLASGYNELTKQLQSIERTTVVEYNSPEFERLLSDLKNHGRVKAL